MPQRCSGCGVEIPEGSKLGACPKCLMAIGLEASADQTPSSVKFSSFGDYEVLEEIARGGMGVVYKARQKSLNRLVAVKTILFGPKAGADFIKRFRIEASSAAALQHPNIVAIHEVGVHDGEHYLVMDYVEGPNLAQLAKDEPLSAERAVRYLRKVAEAIHHAHEKGILHRDLKPSNVLIDSNDEPRVTDFGLAKRLGTDTQPSTDLTQLTLSGHVLGSPGYMPPEQAIGARGRMSRRSDVYSLGAMLYHLLTGRPPFGGGSMADVLYQVQHQEPISPRLLNPTVPLDLETICLKCLEKEPARRYATSRELAMELERFLHDEPICARPVGRTEKVWRWCRRKPALALTISSLAAVLVVGTGGVFWQWRRTLTAEDSARQHLYAGDMNLVQQAIMQGNLGRANALLEQHIPKPGETDRRSWEWHYFRREAQSDALAALSGHVSRVQALAISADGRRLASAGWDSVRLWDIARKQEIASHLETNFYGSAAFSPDGSWLVVGGRSVVQLDGFTLKPIATFPHDSKVIATVALSPDGNTLAVADIKSVRLFKTRPISEIGYLASGVSTVKGALEFFPDGNTLAVGGEDGNIVIWDVRTRERKVQLPGDGKRIKAMAISPDGGTLVTPNGRRRLTLWNLRAQPISSEIPVELSFAGPLAFSPDGHSLAFADNQKIMIWDIDKQSIVANHQGHTYAVECMAFTPENGPLISGSRDTTLMLWKGGSDETEVDYVRLNARDHLETFLHCPKNEIIGIFNSEHTLSIWDTSALKEKARLHLPFRAFLGAIAPDERSVALVSDSFSEGFSLHLIKDLETTATILLDKSPDLIEKVCFARDGHLLAAASADGVVKVWDVVTNRLLARIQTPVGIAGSLAFFPDGQALVTGGAQDWTVRVWQLPSGKQVAEFPGHQGPVSAIEVSSDQRKIITASFDGTARIWSLANKALVATFKGQLLNLLCVDLSDDGHRLATGAGDGTVKLWDVTSQREVAALNTHVESVWKVAFSSNGRKLMATSADRISCWNSDPR